MRDLVYASADVSISVDGDRLVLSLAHGPSGLPMHLEIFGQCLRRLSVAAQRAVERRRRMDGRVERLRRVRAANDAEREAVKRAK